MVRLQSNHAQSDSINDVTSVKWLENKTLGYNAMIMVTHRKFSSKSRKLLYPSVLIKVPDKKFT
jgi:hypothetical protein